MNLFLPVSIPFLLLVFWFPTVQTDAASGGWERVKAEDGVVVYEKKINRRLEPFRGVGEIAGETRQAQGTREPGPEALD